MPGRYPPDLVVRLGLLRAAGLAPGSLSARWGRGRLAGVSRAYRLLAMLAPGSIEASVARLQQAVFSQGGSVSAIALPPLVPIRFLEAGGSGRLPERPGQAAPSRWRASGTGLRKHQGSLFLGLDTGGAWSAVRSDDRYREGEALFPAFEGFFLGCLEEQAGEDRGCHEEGKRPAAPELNTVIPAVAFSSADIAILRLEVAQSPPWWQEVAWEIEDRRPLRGKSVGQSGT